VSATRWFVLVHVWVPALDYLIAYENKPHNNRHFLSSRVPNVAATTGWPSKKQSTLNSFGCKLYSILHGIKYIACLIMADKNNKSQKQLEYLLNTCGAVL